MPPAPSQLGVAGSGPSRTRGRILIVDDDVDFGEALVALLDPRAYEIFLAHSAAEARELLAGFNAQVVLVDVLLGQENGISLIRELRCICPDARCVIMTAYAELDNAIAAIQEGAFDYLRKPLDETALFATLERCFEWIRVSEQKVVAEAALRESEERYRGLVSNVPGVVFRCANDRRWTMQFVSDVIRELTGYPAADLIDDRRRSYGDLIHAEDREWVWARVQESLARREPFVVEYRLVDSGGKVRWLSMRGRGVVGEDGEIHHLDGVIYDVTEHRRSEEDRRSLQEQLNQAQKMEAIGQLAGGVAHDFNNLLTVILGNVGLLQRLLPKLDVTDAALDGIERAAEQATGVTRSLLTFSHRLPVEKRNIDLREVVERTAGLLERLLPSSVEFLADVESGVSLRISADPTQVQQVLLNLAINARDAMPTGGKLRIRAARAGIRDLERLAGGLDDVEYVTVVVSDNGEGMTRAVRERAFDPFYTTKKRGHGTGLGLAIVHGIVEEHGGQILVESESGRGASFTVFLPLEGADSLRGYELPTGQTRRGRGETILLAEPDALVRGSVKSGLEVLGYNVIEATDGPGFLDAYRQDRSRIRALVVDLGLPKRDGLDCLAEIRADDTELPAIMITGSVERDIEKRLDSGTVLLRKPLQMGQLGDRVHLALSGSKSKRGEP